MIQDTRVEIQKITKNNLSNEVCEQILELIKQGAWQSGEKLPSESELIEKFGVSRVSIRSAMDKLRGKAVIETYQGRGSFVAQNVLERFESGFSGKLEDIGKDDYYDIMEFRKAIELTAIELLVHKCSDEDIEKINLSLDKMKNSIDDYKKFTEADYEFHQTIILASKNRIFIEILKQNEKLFKKYLLMQNSRMELNFTYSLAMHSQIYEAIKQRNADHAIQLIKQTFSRNTKRLFGNEGT